MFDCRLGEHGAAFAPGMHRGSQLEPPHQVSVAASALGNFCLCHTSTQDS